MYPRAPALGNQTLLHTDLHHLCQDTYRNKMLHHSVITLLALLPFTRCDITLQLVLNENETPTINYYGESINPINAADIDKFKLSNETLKQTIKDRLHIDASKVYIKDPACPGLGVNKWKEVTTITKPVNAFVQSVHVTPVTYSMVSMTKNINSSVFTVSYRTIMNTVKSTWLNNEQEHDDKRIYYRFQFPGIESPINHANIFGRNFSLKTVFHPSKPERRFDKKELKAMLGNIRLVVKYEVEVVGHVLYLPYSSEGESKWQDVSYLITGVHGSPAKYVTTEVLTINYHWIPTTPKKTTDKPSETSQ